MRGGQQEITKLSTESRLANGNLADFPYEVSAVLSLDSSLSRFQCGSFLNPLGLIPQSRSSKSDGLTER